MSTDYVPDKPILFSRLKTFNHNGVRVDSIEDDDSVILTDGINYFWAILNPQIETILFDENGPGPSSIHQYKGVMFTRYARNDPARIINAIEDFFNVRLISEDEEEFDEIVG